MSDLRQLRYFLTLAECLNYSRAAERLSITQPPLSRQIATLEKKLSVQLFERHHQGVSLTPAGESFRKDATAIVNAYEQACRNARQAQSGENGALSVGFMMHAAWSTIPGLTRTMTNEYPGVKLHLQEATPGSLVDDIVDGRYDVGLVFNPGPVQALGSLTLWREKLCLAVNANHPLATKPTLVPRDLHKEPLIATPYAVAPMLRNAIDRYFQDNHIEAYFRLETQLQQTIVSFVAEALGIAMVPESVQKLTNPNVVYRPLEASPTVEQVLIWREDNKNPALATFLRTAQQLYGVRG